MIVSNGPSLRHGLRRIGPSLALLFAWDVAVTLFYLRSPLDLRPLELPLSLFGTAIALFLGISVNAAYARWWEARGLWGGVAGGSRNLARQMLTFCPAERRGLARDAIRAQVGYAHVLRTALRGEPLPPEAARYLPPTVAASLAGASNRPAAALLAVARLAGEALGDAAPVLRARVDATFSEVSAAQGGMERIRTTPLPAGYRTFPGLFARVFCVLLPFAVVGDLRLFTPVGSTLVSLMFLMALQIGQDLGDPFVGAVHDVPLAALSRGIEVDLMEMLDEPAPEKIAPEDGVLW